MTEIQEKSILKPVSIAIVTSRFNEEITTALYEGAVARLDELGICSDNITAVWVPGAVEIPIVAQRFAELDRIDAVICLGAVIKGDTDHYQYVCEQVNYGCQQVALQTRKPIIFGILTTHNQQQAQERIGGSQGHYGRHSADCAYEMISILRQIKE